MARDHVGPSHRNTPKSVLEAPTPRAAIMSPADAATPSRRRIRVLERRAARAAR